MGMDIQRMMEGVDTPHGRTPGALEGAAKYMIRTGYADILDYLGLRDVPLTGPLAGKYIAARDKQLAGRPVVPAGQRGPTGRIRAKTAINRNHPDCLCAPTGAAYSLCPVHGDKDRLAVALHQPPLTPEDT